MLTRQKTRLEGQVSALSTQNSTLQGEVNTVTTQNTRLQDQVDALTAQNAQLPRTNTTLQNDLAAVQPTIAARDALIAQLQAQLAAQTQVATAMTTTVTASVDLVEVPLQQAFNSPNFTIPGTTPAEQLENLTEAIAALKNGAAPRR